MVQIKIKRILTLGLLFLLSTAIINDYIADRVHNFTTGNLEEDQLENSNGSINIVTPENRTYSTPMNGYFPATYGFESDDSGSDPANLSVYEGAGDVKVIDEIYNHKKVVEMYDGTGANHDEISDSFPIQTYGTIEYWTMSSDASDATQLMLVDDNAVSVWGKTIGWLRFLDDIAKYEDNLGVHDTNKTLYDNTWYHVKVEFECTTGNHQGLAQYTWRFFIDGEKFGDFHFKDNIYNVSKAFFTTRGQDAFYSVYFDAIGYSWHPGYNVGDNLNEGLLLSFETYEEMDSFEYSLDGHVRIPILGNSTIRFPNDGKHIVQVFGEDIENNLYLSPKKTFNVDSLEIITPENKTYLTPMSGYYPATFGFESDESGSDPANLSVYEGAGDVKVIDEIYNHKKVVELYDANNANHDEISDDFPIQTYGSIEYWTMSDDVMAINQLILVDDNAVSVWGRTIGWLRFDAHKVIYEDNLGWHNVDIYTFANTWYHVKVEFECTTGNYRGLAQYTWRFFIEGERFGDFSFKDNINNVSKAFFTTSGQDSAYRVYFDAIGYSWDPYYQIGDNLDEGLLLSFETYEEMDSFEYSLDDHFRIPILGNWTIRFPNSGKHTIQVFANETLYQSELKHFSIDISAPIIHIFSPEGNAFFGTTAPLFNISITELNLNETWYNLNHGINYTFTGSAGTINQTEWDKFGNEVIPIIFFANDTYGLKAYEIVYVQKETIAPSSSILFTPYSGINVVNETTTFTLTADDGTGSGVFIIRYRINDSSWYDYSTSFTLEGYSPGTYKISYYAIDVAGNVEIVNEVIVELIREQIPGLPIELIILIASLSGVGLIGLITILLLRRKRIKAL